MKKFRVLCSVLLVFCLVLSTTTIYAAEEKTVTVADVRDAVVAQAIEESDLVATKICKTDVLYAPTLSKSGDPEPVAVEVTYATTDDTSEKMTIVPYIIDKDDNIVSAFSQVGTRAVNTNPENTISGSPSYITFYYIRATEYYYSNVVSYKIFGKPKTISFKYKTNASGVTVNSMSFNYTLYGTLHAYPDCLNQSNPASLGANASMSASRTVYSPASNTYYAQTASTASNRILYPAGSTLGVLGFVQVSPNVTYNGSTSTLPNLFHYIQNSWL